MHATTRSKTPFLLGTLLALALLGACTADVSIRTQAENNLPDTCEANTQDSRACDPADTKKTTVCHIPPGNPANAHTICVGNAAVPAHLDHGDFLGTCSCGGDDGDGGGGGGGMGSGGGDGSGDGGGGGLY